MNTYQDVVCAYCGCLCDDLEVEVENNQITKVKGACLIGRNKLMFSQDHLATTRVNGQEASLEAALDEATRILIKAKNPLVYGLSSTSTEAQREAIALAEMLKCTIDNPSSYCHGPGVMARQCVAGDCARTSFDESRQPVPADVSFTAAYSRRDGIVDCQRPWMRRLETNQMWQRRLARVMPT